MSPAPPVVAVVGATATGKSGLGVALAHRLGGEVVSADASQLYRGMDVGTAKLTLAEREGVPHHQLDVLDIVEEASLAAYQREARADLEAVLGRGRVPLLVGGSGLYVRAALDRLEIPPTDPEVRAALQARADTEGTPALFDELAVLDPAAAAAIEPNNTRRVVRALEVVRLTGRPFSATMPTRELLRPTVIVGLRVPRAELDARIARRTRAMFDGGLVEEARGLVEHGLREGRTASRAVGYAQALAVLDGRSTLEEAVEDTALRTRRLVRRQESWFGADPRIHWLDATGPRLLDEALALVERAATA
ncbi:tRNA (adenosine(37)-N6)-dimethylallyltransferase MiaA [Phycicoccus sp. MAQZ13P-2]|uniref:tRNA (adenosine(37)-N6)-dimethylallyltransferase MiaA n=1 Tax=Phycicoccus mangrovi TaxID=2840470 RepID=UPI001C003F37|nr:tRNA (adenosine(37)-N6)-dimethylallyltransferase MiaA [Phycicoccus mangrovi]MBT9258087.1 tRNA (adenosine(37)-N6)-dimethylallyltransferase MiaA [Phycicoccus mangrovi]MBT9276298.1 tRNA (adenosine(37)-N6)-dimethylallyltransferase MiaA [Phycicoccus mangrovi]